MGMDGLNDMAQAVASGRVVLTSVRRGLGTHARAFYAVHDQCITPQQSRQAAPKKHTVAVLCAPYTSAG